MKGPYQTTASLICRHKRGENDKNGILGKRRWLSLSIQLGNIIKLSSSAVGVPALCGSTDFTLFYLETALAPAGSWGITEGIRQPHKEPVRSPSFPNLELKEPGGCSLTA